MDLLPLSPHLPGGCTREEAASQLSGRGLVAWCRRWQRGALSELRLVEVPYRVFEVRVENAGRTRVQWLAADAITGGLDLYGFDQVPAAADESTDGMRLPPCVPPERLATLVEESVRRQVYARGFFQLRGLRIEVQDTQRTLRVPYWVGIRRKGGRARLEVLGAWRRRREGSRLADALRPWIAA